MPRSPCRESTGWRNIAGVPVDVKVAAILRAINPDLPRPDTMRRPFASARRRTAFANAGPRRSPTRRIASASRASRGRPRSARSLGSVRDIATLQEVLREQALPLAPGLEDQLGDFPNRPLAAGHRRHDGGSGLHLRHAVRHGDREPHAVEQREVREVIADEGAFVPAEPTPLEQRLERGELARGRILDHLVHLELARAQPCGGRFAPGEPHHDESGGAEHPDAEAVLDVKALEFDRVIADHADVDTIVGQDAVNVETDELQAAGDGSVEHRHFRAWAWAGGTALARASTTAPPPPWDLAAAVPPARAGCPPSNASVPMAPS